MQLRALQRQYTPTNVIKPAYTYFFKPIINIVSFVAEKVSTAIHWIDKNITFGFFGWLGKNTIGRIYQFGNWVYNQFSKPKIIKDIYPPKM